MLVRVAVTLLLLVLGPSVACAEKRVALVIGNGAYAKVGALTNPPRDADAIQTLLRAARFSVETKRDLGLAAMRRALRDFSDQVRDADIAAVFFAGHGIEVNGNNYLIPVDAILERDTDVEDETVSLERITQSLEQAKRLRFVILDACRDNPFMRSMKRTVSSRSIGRGLAEVRVLTSDTLIAFAAKAGSTAADGDGSNSPYTLALVKHLTSPGIDLRLALGRVRDEVLKTTANRQEPHYYGSLGGAEIALMLAEQTPAGSTVTPHFRLSEAVEAWDRIRDTTNVTVLERFIARYKDTFYAELAQVRIDELKKQQVAVASSPPAQKPGPAPQAKPAASTAPQPPQPTARCDGVEIAVGASERRCLKPGSGQVFKDCPDCPEMVVVPAGSFTMGSAANEPEREPIFKGSEDQLAVSIAKPFAVGRFAVTRAQFATFVTEARHKIQSGCIVLVGSEIKLQPAASWQAPGFAQDDRHPAVCVNWGDAKAFAAWLTKKTGKLYRLLSDVEREYVTRAGTATTFWWGPSISAAGANYNGTVTYGGGGVAGEYRRMTMPTDSFAPNGWGLYNVHGNVWEWAEDCWNEKNAGGSANGNARTSGNCELRVLRGGSWWDTPKVLRSANRHRVRPDDRYGSVSFRLARTLDPLITTPRAATPLSSAEELALKPKDSFKECDNCPEMVVAPTGEFMMGAPKTEEGRANEEPQHKVTISKRFAVGRYAVTRGEFAAFAQETNHPSGGSCFTYDGEKPETAAGRSFRNPGFAQDDRHPAVCVTWDDAKAFAAWLGKKTGKHYRLLTEAEREYVTRAGTTTPFWWGSSISPAQANYNGSLVYGGGTKGESRRSTVPVDSFEANPWGLYNVHGNVWEWVEDCSHVNYQGAPTDGSAWISGDCRSRIQRGGAWFVDPKLVRAALRWANPPATRYSGMGLRVARTL